MLGYHAAVVFEVFFEMENDLDFFALVFLFEIFSPRESLKLGAEYFCVAKSRGLF